MSDRRILFLVPRREDVSVRFRVEQLRPHLARRGFSSEVLDLRQVAAARFPPRELLRRAERVVVHRAFLDRASLLWLRLCAGGWVFDFDDAIHLADPHRPGITSAARERRLARMIGGADRVIAGNDPLAGVAGRWSNAVAVVPTTVDLDEAATLAEPPADREVVGWIGTRVNLPYLERILPAIRRLQVRRPGLALRIVCDAFPESSDPSERIHWTRDGEAAAIRGLAVGLMPLPDDAWTRGKCGLKILQYFAAARPVVCSPVGANLAIVEHGRNGFFAVNDEEWIERLERLLSDPAERARMGAAARRTVEDRYSTAGNVGRFLAALGLDGSS